MRIARVAAAVAVAASGLAMVTAPAAAGGGCHKPATSGRGVVVELVEICLAPTVVYSEPGTTVTFVNRDPMEHNVFGSGFYGDLPNAGDTFERRFDAAGVYPYTCTIHPGMTGAVVVGDGGVDAVPAMPATETKQLIAATSDGGDIAGGGSGTNGVPIPAAAAAGLALAAAAAFAGRRTVRRTA